MPTSDQQDLIDAGRKGTAVAQPSWAGGDGQYGPFAAYDGLNTPVRPQLWQLEHAIRTDGRTALLEQALTLPLRGAVPHFEAPAGDTGQTAWVTEQLTRPANAGGMSVPLELVLGQMSVATWQRTACFEKVWRPVDGGTRVGYDAIEFRPGATVKRDLRTGAFLGFTQQVPKIVDGMMQGTETITVEPAKSFVYVHGSHRDPLYGIGDLDVAWLIADTKRKLRFLWWKFLENVSFPSARLKTDLSAADTAGLNAAALRAASLRSGGVLPLAAGEDLLPYDSNGAGAAQFQAALDYLSSEQAQSVLAGFADLTSTSKNGGSYALSVSATDLFTGGRDSVLREIAAAMTSYVVADLVKWNFGADAPAPKVVFAPLKQTDLAQTVSLLQAMARETADSMIPQAFVDELAIKTAGYLELDVEKVRSSLLTGHPIGSGSAAIDQATGQPIAIAVQAAAAANAAPPAVSATATAVERARQLVLAHDAVRAA